MAPGTQRPVFFISHSSADLPATDRTVLIRDALAAELDRRGWDVFLDRQVLQAGDRWRTNIVYGLSRANAAAILFNDKAIARSDWVTAEGMILCFHKSVDPQFQLVPVMLEGKTLQDTKFGQYQPFELNQIQGFPDDPARTEAAIASEIADKFDIQRARNVQVRWCGRAKALLSQVRDRATLESAARCLQVEVDAQTRLSPPDSQIEQLLFAIVAVLHQCDPLDAIQAVSEIFIPLDDSNRDSLKKLVLAKWVPNESVELLMGAARSPSGSVLTIATMASAAVDQYMNRVRIEIQGGQVWAFSVSAATGDTTESKVGQVEETIRKQMVPEPYYDDNGDELSLADAINKVMDPGDVAICVLPSSCSDEDVLSKLRAGYSKILFVAQTGVSTDLKALEKLSARPLTPPFTFVRSNQLNKLMTRIDAALRSARLN